LPEAAIELVDPHGLEQAVATATALVPSGATVSGELLAHAPSLRLIQQWGTGLENVDIAAATRHGIPVANTHTQDTGAAEAIAEWCVMVAIALGRGFSGVQAQVRAGQPWGAPPGLALFGQTAGIIGLGGIGQAVARHLQPFGMRLVAIKRHREPGLAERLGLEWLGTLEDLPRLLQEARFVFLCVPLNAETRDLLGAREFDMVSPGTFLINAARGAIVDRLALVDALQQGRLGGAALDVFWREPPDPEDPLLHMPNVLVSPHVSGVTTMTYERVAGFVANNIRRVLAGQLPLNCANPEVRAR
jgi:phosphoglycerate dehydrogenase-like enzyme